MIASVSLAASPDGAWLARRTGNRLSLHATTRLGETRAIELDTDDVDLVFAGPPDQLLVIARGDAATQVLLFNPPDLEVAARAEIAGKAELGGVTGPRLALISGEHRTLVLVRCAPRALVVQPVDAGPLIEQVVGLEGNRLLVCQAKKIEQWDAVMRRPVLRLHLPLPPAPRWVGAAKGAFWAARKGKDDVQIYRASDGRVFEHRLGAGVIAATSHIASTHVVFATDAGIARVHAFAHSTVAISTRVAAAIAQTVTGDHELLFGCDPDGALWRLSLDEVAPAAAPDGGGAVAPPARGGFVLDTGAAAPAKVAPARSAAAVTPIAGARAERDRTRPSTGPANRTARPTPDGARAWRDGVARWSAEAIARTERGDRGERGDAALPQIPFDAPLAALGDRVAPAARRALSLLYGAWLRGQPRIALASAAAALGGDDDAWAEALGTGQLAAHAWIAIDGGTVALVPAVARYLDGAAPRAIRVIGDPPGRDDLRGVALARASADGDGTGDADLDALAARLGAIAVAARGAELGHAALEARLHEAVLVVPADGAGDDEVARLAAFAAGDGDALVWIAATDAPLPAALAALPPWPPPL